MSSVHKLTTTTDFKDGDDFDYVLESLSVEPVENGYIVTFVYDMDEEKEVYMDKKQLLDRIKELL